MWTSSAYTYGGLWSAVVLVGESREYGKRWTQGKRDGAVVPTARGKINLLTPPSARSINLQLFCAYVQSTWIYVGTWPVYIDDFVDEDNWSLSLLKLTLEHYLFQRFLWALFLIKVPSQDNATTCDINDV